jgi:SAM-dependent methyltransferase
MNDIASNGDAMAEQIAYYEARAPEYDDFYERRGIFNHGEAANRRFYEDVDTADAALRSFHATGKVLELACGTGFWTERLARTATSVLAVDASPSVIALNRTRLAGAPHVSFVVADVLEWEPPEQFDVVFFGLWLHLVPADRFEDFWSLVDRSLVPGGRVFFIDGFSQTPGRFDRVKRLVDPGKAFERAKKLVVDPGKAFERVKKVVGDADSGEGRTATRHLKDGREFQIVELYHSPDTLASRLRDMGWAMELTQTPKHFLIGHGHRDVK